MRTCHIQLIMYMINYTNILNAYKTFVIPLNIYNYISKYDIFYLSFRFVVNIESKGISDSLGPESELNRFTLRFLGNQNRFKS